MAGQNRLLDYLGNAGGSPANTARFTWPEPWGNDKIMPGPRPSGPKGDERVLLTQANPPISARMYGPQDLRSPAWPGYRSRNPTQDYALPDPETEDERDAVRVYQNLQNMMGGEIMNEDQIQNALMRAYMRNPAGMRDIDEFINMYPGENGPPVRRPWDRVPRRGAPIG